MHKVIFVIGTGHSGSTLLDLLLGSHSMTFSLGELKYVSRRINNTNNGLGRICSICADECEFWNNKAYMPALQSYFGTSHTSDNKPATAMYVRFGSFKGNIYQHLFKWSKAQVLVDSSKTTWWVKRQLRPFWHWQNITPYLIYICRDGRAVVNSYQRKYAEKDIATLTKSWVKQTLDTEQYFRSFSKNKRLKVLYEDLATSPEETMRSICRWLDLPYEPEMLGYWRYDHHIVGGNLGTRSLIFKHRKQFDDDSMAQLWSHVNRKDKAHYDQVDLAIKLDQRWQDELTQQQLDIFDSIAGKINEPYSY